MHIISDISTKLQSTVSPAMRKINTHNCLCVYIRFVLLRRESALHRLLRVRSSKQMLVITQALVRPLTGYSCLRITFFFPLFKCLSPTQLSMQRLITRLEKQVQYNIYWPTLR